MKQIIVNTKQQIKKSNRHCLNFVIYEHFTAIKDETKSDRKIE